MDKIRKGSDLRKKMGVTELSREQNRSEVLKTIKTETALLKIVNDILLTTNKQHVTVLALLDLSAAFDTVDHDILIKRLTTKFGTNRVVLNWFKSYLEGRSQHVSVQGSVSEKFDLRWGVPKFLLGSIIVYVIRKRTFQCNRSASTKCTLL